MLESNSVLEYGLIYNTLSFTFAVMAAASIYFFMGRSDVMPRYKSAVTITGLVTVIAAYHYYRIFLSFTDSAVLKDGIVTATGYAFNDAYRYVDWLLTVPLLLVELILVMDLTNEETVSKSLSLGGAAALMIILGYPGEISADMQTRWTYWTLAMIPFLYIVYQLVVGLHSAKERQPVQVSGLLNTACWLLVLSWAFYPIVFLAPMAGFSGPTSYTLIQVGYSVADIVAKAVFGLLIFNIAKRKSVTA